MESKACSSISCIVISDIIMDESGEPIGVPNVVIKCEVCGWHYKP